MPIGDTGVVFDALMAAGQPHGIAPAGYRAIESLRLEKGYRAWGQDITPNDDPFQAGLVMGGEAEIGQALPRPRGDRKNRRAPLTKRLMTFTVADPAILLSGRETILRNGERVGYLASGGWGYTVGANIGMGYVRNPDGVTDDFLQTGVYELEVATERVPATLHFGPLYDPAMTRIKA